jgi:predicted metalloprotease with PDZ domain
MVKFYISNTDPGYYKIRVYYTVDTSDILQNAVTSARRIEHDYLINESYNSIITITGYENTTEVPLEEINP